MKKTLLIAAALACLLTQAAFATITLTVNPASQGGISPNGTFNVTLSLQVTSAPPPDMTNFDVIFEALQNQNGGIANGAFTITNRSPGSGLPGTWAAFATTNDALSLVGTQHSGFVQGIGGGANGNEGFGDTVAGNADKISQSTLAGGIQLATYTFTLSNVAPGTYTFGTTLASQNSSKGSDLGSTDTSAADGATYFGKFPFNNAAFTITVVPEPATWSLLGLGGLGSLGLNLLRRRRS